MIDNASPYPGSARRIVRWAAVGALGVAVIALVNGSTRQFLIAHVIGTVLYIVSVYLPRDDRGTTGNR